MWNNEKLGDVRRWLRRLESSKKPGGELSSIFECVLNRSSYEDYVADSHSHGSRKLNDVVKLSGTVVRPNDRRGRSEREKLSSIGENCLLPLDSRLTRMALSGQSVGPETYSALSKDVYDFTDCLDNLASSMSRANGKLKPRGIKLETIGPRSPGGRQRQYRVHRSPTTPVTDIQFARRLAEDAKAMWDRDEPRDKIAAKLKEALDIDDDCHLAICLLHRLLLEKGIYDNELRAISDDNATWCLELCERIGRLEVIEAKEGWAHIRNRIAALRVSYETERNALISLTNRTHELVESDGPLPRGEKQFQRLKTLLMQLTCGDSTCDDS